MIQSMNGLIAVNVSKNPSPPNPVVTLIKLKAVEGFQQRERIYDMTSWHLCNLFHLPVEDFDLIVLPPEWFLDQIDNHCAFTTIAPERFLDQLQFVIRFLSR